MVSSTEVRECPDVCRPGEVGGVLRPGEKEVLQRQPSSRRDKQLVEARLPITCVGAQVGEVVAQRRTRFHGTVHVRVDASVERRHSPGAKYRFQTFERIASRITENEVELTESTVRKVADVFM